MWRWTTMPTQAELRALTARNWGDSGMRALLTGDLQPATLNACDVVGCRGARVRDGICVDHARIRAANAKYRRRRRKAGD